MTGADCSRWLLLIAIAAALCTVMLIAPVAAQQAGIKVVPAPRTAASSPEEMFKSYCASCHGLDAKGKGPAAAALKTPPGDLTTLARANGGKFPELRVLNSISGDSHVPAHGSKDMPVWGSVFRDMASGSPGGETQLRLRNLTKYIGSLQVK
ncbi:MAG: c-type cytochrome [Bryobacterales bacterium]|nr:c-type cytochrome [Bryobacterales bacterium]